VPSRSCPQDNGDRAATGEALSPRLCHHSSIGQIPKLAALQSLDVALPQVLCHDLFKRPLNGFAQRPGAKDGSGSRHQSVVNCNTRLSHGAQSISDIFSPRYQFSELGDSFPDGHESVMAVKILVFPGEHRAQ
jgi:hypothetical protein